MVKFVLQLIKVMGSLTYIFTIRSFLKTVYFNFYYFPFKTAVKLPVFVSKRVILEELGGEVVIEGDITRGMIKIGLDEKGLSPRSVWMVSGRVVFKGPAYIGPGSQISVSGELVFGRGFCAYSGKCSFIVSKKVVIGDGCSFSWENTIMDSDQHPIYIGSEIPSNPPKEIIFGNEVWLGCRCTVLKGTVIGNNCVIGTNTLLNKPVEGDNLLIAGNPAKVVRTGVTFDMNAAF